MPEKPTSLSGGVVSADGPMTSAPSATGGKDGDKSYDQQAHAQSTKESLVSRSPSASPTEDFANPIPIASSAPAGDGAVTAGASKSHKNDSNNGSINECASRNGQNCKVGMCCSSHGCVLLSNNLTKMLMRWLGIVALLRNTVKTAANRHSVAAPTLSINAFIFDVATECVSWIRVSRQKQAADVGKERAWVVLKWSRTTVLTVG